MIKTKNFEKNSLHQFNRIDSPDNRYTWFYIRISTLMASRWRLTFEKIISDNNIPATEVRRNDAWCRDSVLSFWGANILLMARKRAEIKWPLSEFTSEKVPTCHQRLVYVFLAGDGWRRVANMDSQKERKSSREFLRSDIAFNVYIRVPRCSHRNAFQARGTSECLFRFETESVNERKSSSTQNYLFCFTQNNSPLKK